MKVKIRGVRSARVDFLFWPLIYRKKEGGLKNGEKSVL